MNSLTEFLFPAPARRRTIDIIGWWEKRRLPYNLIVGSAGLVSLGVMSVISLLLPMGGQGFFIPWQPIVAFGVMANVFYLLGPAAELLIHRLFRGEILPTGPALYRMGLTFSVGLALFPALLMMVILVVQVVVMMF